MADNQIVDDTPQLTASVFDPKKKEDSRDTLLQLDLRNTLYLVDAIVVSVSSIYSDEYTVDIYDKGFLDSAGNPIPATREGLKAHCLHSQDWFRNQFCEAGQQVKVHILNDNTVWIKHPETPQLGIVVCNGCNGEAESTLPTNYYFIKLARIANNGTSFPHIYEPYIFTDPRYNIVVAENLFERNCQTHFVRPGTVVVLKHGYDNGSPVPHRRYYFEVADEGTCAAEPCNPSASSSSSYSSSSGSSSSAPSSSGSTPSVSSGNPSSSGPPSISMDCNGVKDVDIETSNCKITLTITKCDDTTVTKSAPVPCCCPPPQPCDCWCCSSSSMPSSSMPSSGDTCYSLWTISLDCDSGSYDLTPTYVTSSCGNTFGLPVGTWTRTGTEPCILSIVTQDAQCPQIGVCPEPVAKPTPPTLAEVRAMCCTPGSSSDSSSGSSGSVPSASTSGSASSSSAGPCTYTYSYVVHCDGTASDAPFVSSTCETPTVTADAGWILIASNASGCTFVAAISSEDVCGDCTHAPEPPTPLPTLADCPTCVSGSSRSSSSNPDSSTGPSSSDSVYYYLMVTTWDCMTATFDGQPEVGDENCGAIPAGNFPLAVGGWVKANQIGTKCQYVHWVGGGTCSSHTPPVGITNSGVNTSECICSGSSGGMRIQGDRETTRIWQQLRNTQTKTLTNQWIETTGMIIENGVRISSDGKEYILQLDDADTSSEPKNVIEDWKFV